MSAGGGSPPQQLARRYSGFFNAVVAGAYWFSLTSDDGSFLWLDGVSTPLIDDFTGGVGAGCGATRDLQLLSCIWHSESGGLRREVMTLTLCCCSCSVRWLSPNAL